MDVVSPEGAAAPERYVRLGLALGRHLDGMVDSYYGPPAWRAEVEAGAATPLPALVAEAERLLADLDGGVDAEVVDARRRAWLRAQVRGLRTVGRTLAGDDVGYLEEVAECYGVHPEPVPEEALAAAHRRLDEVVPGSGPLRERVIAWREAHSIAPDRLEPAVRSLAEDFAARTDVAFGLPDGEAVEWVFETDKPWSGFNYYLGDLRSRVAINVDLPVQSLVLGHLVAHEAYPGHHTEATRKEVGLARRQSRVEETIALVGTPQCVMAEGLADLALDALLGDEVETVLSSHFAALGLRYDAVDEAAAVARALAAVSGARGTMALMLHAEGRPATDVVAWAERWLLAPRERAEKSVAFISDPTWRAYVFCYTEGVELCRRFVAGDPARFERLLTEQLTPADLAVA